MKTASSVSIVRSIHLTIRLCFVSALALSLVPQSKSQNQHNQAHTAESGKPMLLAGMGDVHHPISTSNAEAQKFFDQGLALVYGFNRGEALRSFKRAAELDPKSAMAYWGIALSLGPHVNMDSDGDVQPKAGYEAMMQAIGFSPFASVPERAYIEALAKRFSSDEKADEKRLSIEYRKAMRDLVQRYPDDLDAATLYAESIMCLSRWDYWNANGSAKEGTDEFVTVLEGVLRRDPHHLGANHYYIHAVEASPTPERALPSAARLMGLAPMAGHLVHMPGHIFMRTGDFAQAAYTNERAVQADRDYFKIVNAPPNTYSMGYHSHNLHFIVVARSMQGRFEEAKKAADELAANVAPGAEVMPAMADYFGANQLFVLLRFNRWDDLLRFPRPGEKLGTMRALWHFARAIAYAKTGKAAEAGSERAAFNTAVSKIPAEAVWTFDPVRKILRVAEAVLDARLSPHDTASVEHWKRAVAAQDALHYDEPPAWFYPVRESLGAALLRIGRAAEAETVFREDLRLNPRNGRSLFGLMKSLEAQKKTVQRDQVQREFERAWKFAQLILRIEDL
jgi:tetratricopeptide (TPR) repeat protein